MAEKALLVTILLGNQPDGWNAEDSAQELKLLARSCGVFAECSETLSMKNPHPRQFIGKGQAERYRDLVRRLKLGLVILSRDLTGTQQRNLEDLLGCKTIDRTQLILDIFARRAHTNEGKVQVELAQLTYLLPRLVGRGIMLSRLGGGIGTRGPGEQKLETHRRRIRDRITALKRELNELVTRRDIYRRRRKEHALPTVALVGYTNVGKSRLFNALTESSVDVRDQLFSTLDPTVRTLVLHNHQKILLVDTVGFLHLLPHHLIDAFKATLEEVVEADLVLHIVDVSHSRSVLLEKSVNAVLRELGAHEKPYITVLNKIDQINPKELETMKKVWREGVLVSALKRLNFEELCEQMEKSLAYLRHVFEFQIPLEAQNLIHEIYEGGQVLERKHQDHSVFVKASLPWQLGNALTIKLRKLKNLTS